MNYKETTKRQKELMRQAMKESDPGKEQELLDQVQEIRRQLNQAIADGTVEDAPETAEDAYGRMVD